MKEQVVDKIWKGGGGWWNRQEALKIFHPSIIKPTPSFPAPPPFLVKISYPLITAIFEKSHPSPAPPLMKGGGGAFWLLSKLITWYLIMETKRVEDEGMIMYSKLFPFYYETNVSYCVSDVYVNSN